jgi:hypothetical protein
MNAERQRESRSAHRWLRDQGGLLEKAGHDIFKVTLSPVGSHIGHWVGERVGVVRVERTTKERRKSAPIL